MNKLTADRCRDRIASLKRNRRVFGLAMDSELYLKALEIALPVLEQQEKGSEGWIEWRGGDCPVDDYVRVEVLWRDQSRDIDEAHRYDWSEPDGTDPEGDIIAYRVIENDGSE